MFLANRLFTKELVLRRSSLFQARFSACHPSTSFKLQAEKSSGQEDITSLYRQKRREGIGGTRPETVRYIALKVACNWLLPWYSVKVTDWHLRISPARPLSSDPARYTNQPKGR